MSPQNVRFCLMDVSSGPVRDPHVAIVGVSADSQAAFPGRSDMWIEFA